MPPEHLNVEQLAKYSALFKKATPAFKGGLLVFILHFTLLIGYHYFVLKPACDSFAQIQSTEHSHVIFDDVVYPSGGKYSGYGHHFLLGYGKFHTLEFTGIEAHEKRFGLWEIMGFSAFFSLFAMPYMFAVSLVGGAYFLNPLFQAKTSTINKESL